MTIDRGVICALRHIHMTPADALRFGVRDKSFVRVRVEGDRELIFGDVLVRVDPSFALAMHIDTDEANAANLRTGAQGHIERRFRATRRIRKTAVSRSDCTPPSHKTKIVATIGPASESPEMLERLIRAGLNVARLNFSHGDFTGHAERIARIRAAEQATGRRVAIMADLPGPKMRIGKIEPEPIQLRPGDAFTLTSEDIVGNAQRVSMSFEPLPAGGEAGRPAVPERRPGATGRRARGGQRRALQSRGRRRAALAEGPQPAGHRSRHQRVHRPRPRLPGIRARRTAWTR